MVSIPKRMEVADWDEACARRVLETIPVVMRYIAAGVHHELDDGRWLTMGQFRVLHLIWKGVGSVSDLARCQNVSQPTISRQVDGLVKKGLVTREPDLADRRVIHLALSEKGDTLLQDLEARACRRVSETLASLTVAEKERVYEGLALLQSAFEQSDEQ